MGIAYDLATGLAYHPFLCKGEAMTVKEMIYDYLQANGYTGLVCDEIPCGCPLDDMEPGGDCMCGDVCEAGYVHYCKDCPKEIQDECTVEDGASVGGYCVGPEKELKVRPPDPPPEPWITDAKLQDRVEFYGDLSLETKRIGTVKIISPDHRSLRVLEEGMGMLARVTPEIFIRIIKPEAQP
jgi:hypothetical protein